MLRRFGKEIQRRKKSTYVAAIDQGTSSSRVILYDAETLLPRASHQIDLTSSTSTPSPGWAEINATDIYRSVEESARGAMEKLKATPSDIVGLGITNQRESLCVWDRTSGEPLHPCILWLDTRNRDTVATLEKELGGDSDALRHKCGLPISTYFSGVKLRWLMDNVPDVAKSILDGDALIGTVDSWLIWKLTNGETHVTDVTNASRTMMMDLESVSWDEDLLSSLGLSQCLEALPEIVPSADSNMLGRVSEHSNSPLAGVPITGCIGDQQSAMVGQKCFGVGDAKTTYGTGAFTLINTGNEPCASNHGLLTTVLYQMGSEKSVQYALEGSVGSCAVGLNWFCDSLDLFENAPEITRLAEKAPKGSDGVYFVSAFGGLFAPHWRDDARGTLVGLTLAHDKTHIARAALEGIAFQVTDVVDAMVSDSGVTLSSMRVDGGVCQSNPLLQTQADLLGTSVLRPDNIETTALGAAIAASIGSGLHELESFARSDKVETFESAMNAETRNLAKSNWKRAVKSSLEWADRGL